MNILCSSAFSFFFLYFFSHSVSSFGEKLENKKDINDLSKLIIETYGKRIKSGSKLSIEAISKFSWKMGKKFLNESKNCADTKKAEDLKIKATNCFSEAEKNFNEIYLKGDLNAGYNLANLHKDSGNHASSIKIFKEILKTASEDIKLNKLTNKKVMGLMIKSLYALVLIAIAPENKGLEKEIEESYIDNLFEYVKIINEKIHEFENEDVLSKCFDATLNNLIIFIKKNGEENEKDSK